MIVFQHLRRRRLSVRLTELTLGDGIAIAKLPADRPEMTTTELLRRIAKDADKPQPHFVTNPLLWSVQERAFLVCMYLAQTAADGPDFAVGTARMLDYMTLDRDSIDDETDLGQPVKHSLVLRPLLGVHAQAIEGMCQTRGDWTMCAIACQVFKKGEESPDWLVYSETELRAWIKAKTDAMMGMAESEFEPLFAAWREGCARLSHFADYDFLEDAEGRVAITFLPKEKEGAGADERPTARFLASAAISPVSRILS